MIPTSFLSSLIAAFVVAKTAVAGIPPICLFNTPLSCHNSTAVENLCCFNYPGGQVLQVQFWDTNPATGPEDHWTIHGLW